MFFDIRVWGRENIPPGPKIFVGNHVTSHDGFFVMSLVREPMHFFIGPGYGSPLVAGALRLLEQINARPGNHKTMITSAVEYLRRGEAVCIAPEGDIQELFQLGSFYPGVATLYRRARVPIVPIGILLPKRAMREYPQRATVVDGRAYGLVKMVRGPYCVNFGEPFMPDLTSGTKKEQNDYILQVIRERISALIEDVRMNQFWLC